MVLGLVMIAGVVGACPRNGRAVKEEMVAVLRGVYLLATMNDKNREKEAVGKQVERGRNQELYMYLRHELTHGGL